MYNKESLITLICPLVDTNKKVIKEKLAFYIYNWKRTSKI